MSAKEYIKVEMQQYLGQNTWYYLTERRINEIRCMSYSISAPISDTDTEALIEWVGSVKYLVCWFSKSLEYAMGVWYGAISYKLGS